MHVVTVVLQWGAVKDPLISHDIPIDGWNVKINGLGETDGAHYKNAFGRVEWIMIPHHENGVRLLLTPRGSPSFAAGSPFLASVWDPPLDFVTDCLNQLAIIGYTVVSSHSVVSTGHDVTSVWTLKKADIPQQGANSN